jgi:hypothetical protein
LVGSHIFCLSTIKSCLFFFFSSTRFIVINLHNVSTK